MKHWIQLLLLLPSTAQATILSLAGDTIFLPDFQTPLPVGSHISVGYFDPGFTDFENLAEWTWEALSASVYTEVSTGMINPAPGEWAGGGSFTGIEGQRLYAWVFDTALPPVDLISTDFGLFSGSSPEWIARGDGDLLHPQFNFLTVATADIVIHGQWMDGNLALSTAAGALTPIPEPSSASLLVGLVVAGLLYLNRLGKQVRNEPSGLRSATGSDKLRDDILRR